LTIYNKTAEVSLENNRSDCTSFDTLFISNPDVPKRFKDKIALNEPDQTTFYGGDKKVYTAYSYLNKYRVEILPL